MTGNDFGLPQKTLDYLRDAFSGCPKVEKVILYGSRAKGNYRPGSDIDLTMQGDGLSHRELADIAEKLEDSPLPYMVDLSIFAHIDNPNLIDHIQRVGKVFYQRQNPTGAALL
ncbi:MAG: nucleotidyltransferase domain-containing protein [Sulfuricellaceae bacterium]